MQEEVLAIAIVRPYPGKNAEVLSVLRQLYKVLARKGYSRDELYCDANDDRYFNMRYWKTEESRRHPTTILTYSVAGCG